jgi:hypothetical protein
MASAAAVLGVMVGAGVVAAGPWLKADPTTGTAIAPIKNQLVATDKVTGVHATVGLESKTFGTLVSFAVSNIKGPRKCRLVAVRNDGQSEVLSTWTVPDQGYGKSTEPPELRLEAATALPIEDIFALRVQEVGENGLGSRDLVSVRT